MKILHIPNFYPPHIGGIEQTTKDIVDSLKDSYEQKVFCFHHEKETVEEYIDDIFVHRSGILIKVASQAIALRYKKELKKVISEFLPDVIHFHYPNPYASHFLLKILKKYPNIKLITHWHLDIHKQKILKLLFTRQTRKLLNRSYVVITTSPNLMEESKWLSQYKDKCKIVPSCINEERLAYDDADQNAANIIRSQYAEKTICFAFGRHVEYKGLIHLIQASKFLNDDYVIFIGGSGPLTEELKDAAANDDKIHFVGRLSDSDLKAYFIACDIFCFPSITKNEAFGLGLAEAMYYGKPSVTFIIPGSGVNYVSKNLETGIIVENANDKKYAEAIQYLKDHKDIANMYGLQAKERVSTHFLKSNFKDNINKIYNDIG